MFLPAIVLSACGNSDVKLTDGGACVGHQCDDSALTDPEGGNLILEYIYVDTELAAAQQLPAGVTTVARVTGYFENHQTPDDNAFPMQGQCNNLIATLGWPGYVGSPHEDLDVGTLTINGKNEAGGDVSLGIDKMASTTPGTPVTDVFGRPHDLFYQKILPIAANSLKPDSSFQVVFGGSAKIPASTFDGGLYLANTFQVTNPSLEENGPLIGGTDFTVHWTPSTSANLPTGDQVQVITWLADVTGAPTHMCPVPMSAGQFTIPGSAINEYKQIAAARGLPNTKMVMLRNAVVHQLRRLPNNDPQNKRRMDMLTLMCWAQVMDVQ